MTTPSLQDKFLEMLAEAREEVLSGEFESLAIIARKPKTGQYFSLFAHEYGADVCGIWGFLLICLQKSVKTEQDVERVDGDERPFFSKTKSIN